MASCLSVTLYPACGLHPLDLAPANMNLDFGAQASRRVASYKTRCRARRGGDALRGRALAF